MRRLNLVFGVYCHQPIGNFEHVFAQAHDRAYRPFLEAMAAHPRVKFSVNYSGALYDWFKGQRPEFLELLQKLARRGQVEILASGYYAPILSLIPDEDKLGQIELSSKFIKEQFLSVPRTLWLTERVWEPSLPKALARAGIEHVLLDDDHFLRAGVPERELNGYYNTEDQGEVAAVLPLSRRLRELIPFHSVPEAVEYLRSLADESGEALAVFMVEGEKFGLRPEEHKRVFTDGYLEELLRSFEANRDWLNLTTVSNHVEDHAPKGLLYLPSGSYAEMSEWALPLDFDQDGDGYFRNFLVKYHEANLLHKRMLLVSKRLSALANARDLFGRPSQAPELGRAKLRLYQAQAGDAYWHGRSGGLYANNLRHAAYQNLIKAEKELTKLSRGDKPYVELHISDLDKDGNDEVLLGNDLIDLYFAPARGGALFELDYKPKAFNLVNTLARRCEAHHHAGLPHDKRPRCCLQDHFLSPQATLESFASDDQGEIGTFVSAAYSSLPKRLPSEVGLLLSCKGTVEGCPVKLEKSISLLPGQSLFTVEYAIVNQAAEPDEFLFGVEWNFSLLAGSAPDRYYCIDGKKPESRGLASRGVVDQADLIQLVDEWSGFRVSLVPSKSAALWRFPVETAVVSDGRREQVYQSSAVMPVWRFRLGPAESWQVKITLRIEE
ncbi:MAG: DUF1926 domain-containing protein [Candidatus Saganbacteria bacterium]|nr:DUF1926 domain-containing protein [Candidatus Saganbacteria bacterium]